MKSVRHVLFVLVLAAATWVLFRAIAAPESTPSEHLPFLPPETPQIWAERAALVRDAFVHAYHGYERHAFPHDELCPLSNGSIDNFNGWGVSVVDSLDTMLLMGLDDEYARAVPLVAAANFSLPANTNVPFFETVIRYLGGLLSAYALSRDTIFRDKAHELATKLSPAFDTPSGFPRFDVNTYNASSEKKLPISPSVLAEIASFQMEYAYLGKITSKKAHVDRATTVTNLFYNTNLSLSGGMYPTSWYLRDGKPSRIRLSVGAAADSAHEYTLKQYLLTSRSDLANLEMYLRLTSHVINNLLYVSSQRQLLYVTDSTTNGNRTATSHSFEHLSCFFPGLLALGVHLLPLNNLEAVGINFTHLAHDLPPEHRQRYEDLAGFDLADLHLWAAEGIAQMCYLLYADQPSGLAPDHVTMRFGSTIKWMDAMQEWKASGRIGSPPGVADIRPWIANPNANTIKEKHADAVARDYNIRDTAYRLRPEAVESFYILWRTTGDVKWRHRGWHVFQAIQQVAKTPSGYASVNRVHTTKPVLEDSMPSFFLAETLKYLYLLFLDEDVIPLEKWVFNTEAHPLPVFAWTESEEVDT